MTALILVVDDVPANVKLLEAKLSNEYYDVITARNGFEAIEKAHQHKPDLVLLDVMMPGMDGFEVCRRLKADVAVSHIPVVMVTALSDVSDRVNGLEAGADDFITKPINDTALFARVRSLVRIKVLLDELRLRDKTGQEIGILGVNENSFTLDVSGAHIVLIDDDAVQTKRIENTLSKSYRLTTVSNPEDARGVTEQHADTIDLIVVSTELADADGLRLATQIKTLEALRHVPVIMLVDEHDQALMLKGLELGINDYLVLPVDENEMIARVKTQIRRKKYQEALKSNYQNSISMAITDKLTGLYNRHYLETHIHNMVTQSTEHKKPLSLLIMDMDHFKSVNDTYGHDVGDEVLKQLAEIIVKSTRGSDLAARLGGEEFVVMMPETSESAAYDMAERMRKTVENHMFKISHATGTINKTVSIGVSNLNFSGDTVANLVKRADVALYEAKNSGRNKVLPLPVTELPGIPGNVQISGLAAASALPMAEYAAPPPCVDTGF
jgi:two-component system cell cycle response regulator